MNRIATANDCLRTLSILVLIGLIATSVEFGVPSAAADDWPQWLGPERDSVWHESGILNEFPEGGPKEIWSYDIDGGYAGPAVAGGRVFVTDYVTSGDRTPNPSVRNPLEGTERVICLNAETGEEIWMHEYPCSYRVSYPAGPRVTPTVDGDFVYTVGAMGNLYCLNVEDGSEVWSRDYQEDYGSAPPVWGFCGHPMVDGDRLICLVGGEGSVAVAFDKRTGEEIWRSLSAEELGYCPPMIIEAGGTRQLIIWHGESINGLNPEDGTVYWSVPLKADYSMSIAAPRVSGQYLFAGGIGNKSALLELSANEPKAELVWRGERNRGIGPINMTPVVDGDHLYGVDRRGNLVGMLVETGEHLWSTSDPVTGERPQNSGTAFLVRNGDRYFIFNERGELVIARLSPEGYEEIDRAKLIEPTTITSGRDVVWTHPAYANHCIFVRNDQKIVCYSLAE